MASIAASANDPDEVLIVDDHPLFRDAFATIVRGVAGNLQVREVNTLAEAVAALSQSHSVRIVFLDLKLPDAKALDGLRALVERHPQVGIVVVSANESAEIVREALALGARGFIPKSGTLPVMREALRAVLAGESWSPQLASPPVSEELTASLTPQQLRILDSVLRGRLNKQIAHEFGVTEATIKGHVSDIYRKLGVRTRTQAVLACGHGLTTQQAPDS